MLFDFMPFQPTCHFNQPAMPGVAFVGLLAPGLVVTLCQAS
jgi:hypothetical protein